MRGLEAKRLEAKVDLDNVSIRMLSRNNPDWIAEKVSKNFENLIIRIEYNCGESVIRVEPKSFDTYGQKIGTIQDYQVKLELETKIQVSTRTNLWPESRVVIAFVQGVMVAEDRMEELRRELKDAQQSGGGNGQMMLHPFYGPMRCR